MLNAFPRWKYMLLAATLIVGLIYALPNVYGEDPAVQIIGTANNPVGEVIKTKVTELLTSNNVKYKSTTLDDGELLIRFYTTDVQLATRDLLKDSLGANYSVALNLAPVTPAWLIALGAEPMKLGLDLRGGVRFLMEVDIASTIKRRESTSDHTLTPVEIEQIRNYTMEQTAATLRNRINELGVAEAIIQQQGANRIVVELPGIQDTARAKDILGKTATLDFLLEDGDNDLMQALHGHVTPGSKIYYLANGQPVLLKKRVVLTGNAIVGASSQYDSHDNQPVVAITLGGSDISLFKESTINNINKHMAVIYRESHMQESIIDGQTVKLPVTTERLISYATIRGPLGSNFQISGLGLAEARDLALLLRAGSLPATISIVEERIIGPSMGQENINKGMQSVVVGLSLIVVFMTFYYSLFGVIANIALLFNLILLVALMSLVGATLTLPGIAGIVLTLGMAVDANVLIFERIREELRLGMPPHASIQRGFEHAFSTIIDSNLTTLIVGIILFSIGTGPVKGFAITLSLGILTSLFTAVTGTRAIVELIYGKRNIKKLLVGI